MKEIIDQWLLDHYQIVKDLQDNKVISWYSIAIDISEDMDINDAPDKDYVRKRWASVKKGVENWGKTFEASAVQHIPYNSTGSYEINYGREDKSKGTKEFTFTADTIPTEEEIIAHFNVDVTKYRISQIWHKTAPGRKYSVSVSLLALKPEEAVDYKKAFVNFLDNYSLKVLKNPNTYVNNQKPLESLFLINLADLHIGSNQKPNYLEKISNRLKDVIKTIAGTNVEEIVIANLGDFLHVNNSKNTTYSGTQLDYTNTLEDSFTEGLAFMADLIDYASNHCKKLTIVSTRGNHSWDSEWMLFEGISKMYSKNTNIEIFNSKTPRTYYYWKNNALMFVHGDKGLDRLPLTFATEAPEIFADAQYRTILMGHTHHPSNKKYLTDRGEYNGIDVRVCSSPTSTDRWHETEAFVGAKKEITCLLFNKEDGKYGEYTIKV